MDGNGDYDDEANLRAALMDLVWRASRGQAMLEMQYDTSGERAADGILAAADDMRAVDLWGDDSESWDEANWSDQE